jgi:molecular chaperone DnaK
MPQIEVTFDIDANGIVHVSAKDLATQKEQSIKITASSGLSKDEVEKLVKDAQVHTEDDKKRRKLAEAKNQADNLVYQTEKNIAEYGDKVSAEDKTKIQDAVAELKKALEGTDAAAIESATQRLMTASHKLAEEMYKKAASASAAPGAGAGDGAGDGAGSAKTDEKVVDAEFEEVDKDKK